jgi:hypothetical protein
MRSGREAAGVTVERERRKRRRPARDPGVTDGDMQHFAGDESDESRFLEINGQDLETFLVRQNMGASVSM